MPYSGGNSDRKIRGCLALFIVIPLVFISCGRKDLPVPPGTPDLSPVAGISYKIIGDSVKISWDKPDEQNASMLAGYSVHRSITRTGDETCDGCPVLFQRIAKLGKESTFYKESIAKGNKYIYKVVAISKYGTNSPDSTFVKFEF